MRIESTAEASKTLEKASRERERVDAEARRAVSKWDGALAAVSAAHETVVAALERYRKALSAVVTVTGAGATAETRLKELSDLRALADKEAAALTSDSEAKAGKVRQALGWGWDAARA